MPKNMINEAYLREFFGIPEGQEGEEELAGIRSRLERLQFGHGEDICTIDGEPDGMFFLESGSAVVLDRDGDQINVMREGQYFGEYGVLSGQRRLSTVRSQGRTIVYKMSSEDVVEVLSRHPGVYGELMKRVYGQVSRKHSQLMALSRMQRGILRDPGNKAPMSPLHMVIHYGVLAVIFILCSVLVPAGSPGPVFLVPLSLMVVYVILTRRTVESLVVSGMLAAVLLYRSGLAAGYADALMKSMAAPDNVFTVLVMALMGSVVTLIEASGAVTAFKKLIDRKVSTKKGTMFAAVGVMAVTAIDDCLNMLCAATGVRTAADEHRIPREDTGLLLSFLPTTLCSFIPFSLWGIFVIGSITPGAGNEAASLFCRAIPFNFYSIVTVVCMLLFCADKLPRVRKLRAARQRVEAGEDLWPEGSERYLSHEDQEVWGKVINLVLPVAVLAVSCLAVRSLRSGSFTLDSACGLTAALVFMFFLYCLQGIMSPEKFFEHLVSGIQSMALPILLYLLTMCFTSMLEQQAVSEFFDEAVGLFDRVSPLIPASLFLVSTLLTVALGSSWAMYVIGFPVAMHVAAAAGLSLPLCVGAVCSAGIAGEKNCIFTSDSLSVGNAIGCNPDAVLSVRMQYSIRFTVISLIMYTAAGFIFR